MTGGSPPDSPSGLPILLPVLRDRLKNRIRGFAGRLRDPRYAAALVAGLLYFGWLFFVPGGRAAETTPEELGRLLEALRGIAPFLLAALVGFWWVWGGYERALAFDPSEVHFLFPAPLARRTLLRYKLLKLQGGVLFTSLVLTLLPRGELAWPARFVSWWILVSTLHLHQLASSLTRNAAVEGRGPRADRWIPLSILALAATGLGATLWLALPELQAARSTEGVLTVLARTLERPLPRAVLLPMELALAPIFASDVGAWLRGLPGGLAMLAVHYAWVTRIGTGFEETAIRAGEEKARGRSVRGAGASRMAKLSSGPTRPSRFPLAPTGRPWVAILWKNLTAFTREFRARTARVVLGGAAALFVGLSIVEGSWRSGAGTMAWILGLAAGVLAVFGPLAFRYDLRRDLERVELLRTLPIPGPELLAGEIGASAACLTATQAATLSAAALALPFTSNPPLPLAELYAWAGAALLVLPPLNVVTLTIQNALALFFPDWVRIGRQRPGGVDHMGQSILTLSAALFLTALALVPPLLGGGLTGYGLASTLGPWTALPAAAAGILLLSGEAVLGVWWLGRRWDALDVDARGLV